MFGGRTGPDCSPIAGGGSCRRRVKTPRTPLVPPAPRWQSDRGHPRRPPDAVGGLFHSPASFPLLPPGTPLPILEDYAQSHSAGRKRSGISRIAFAPSTLPPRSARGWPRPRWRPRSMGNWSGPTSCCPPKGRSRLRLLTAKDPEALGILRHSSAHVMARAVMRLFEGVQLAFGPTVDNGFYYDFQMEHALSEEDFPQIEAEMARIVKEDEPFERVEMPRDEAIAVLPRPGPVAQGGAPPARAWPTRPACRSIGRASSSTCAAGRTCPPPARSGPSSSSRWPGPIGRATPSGSSCSGSTAPPGSARQDLDAHLRQVEEAKRRDHRVLGKQLELFLIDPAVGSGLVLWLPKGAVDPPATGELPLRRVAQAGLSAGLYAR